jgi:hypothetical protein
VLIQILAATALLLLLPLLLQTLQDCSSQTARLQATNGVKSTLGGQYALVQCAK